MDTKQITQALERLYDEEHARIVFWNDPEREFENEVPFLDLGDVHLVRLDEMGALELKCQLEKGDPEGKYLLYAPEEEPSFEADWLLDIRLYSRSFRADRASILLDELGLAQQAMRAHLALRRKFCDNKERVQKLKALVAPLDDEVTLDRKMLAVVCRAEQPEPFSIVRALFHQMAMEGKGLEEPPPAWEQVEKYDLDGPFWAMVQGTFGYKEEDHPSLKNLLIRLLLSDFTHHLGGDTPGPNPHLLLSKAGTANAVVCLGQWRDSNSTVVSYDRLSHAVAKVLQVETVVDGLEIEAIQHVMTFAVVERALVRGLRDRVCATADTIDADAVRALARRRQDGHWASPNVPGDTRVQREVLHGAYAALVAASDFFALRNKHRDGFAFTGAEDLYALYVGELFRFDQLYRHFCETADIAEAEGWGLLKPLRADLEAAYVNGYLTKLGIAWGQCVAGGLLKTWRLPGVPNQQHFFNKYVRDRLKKSDRNRVFVVISDALRYEVAQELHSALNREYRLQADLSTHLGVVPSYTGLGMASLLPGKALSYGPGGEVLVDGKPTVSLEDRNAILAEVEGMAIRAEDLLGLKQTEGRALVAAKRVVYIYHNTIDAMGDSASTEAKTFEAVRKAIDEVISLARYIVNNLNGNQVIITADHGFLFTETAPTETDKSKLPGKPDGAVKVKKRYLLGRGLPDYDDAWHGRTADTAGAAGDMEFWVPKGGNRFHFVGGSRFVHGGAMPQEIVVPVIELSHLKNQGSREKTVTRNVTVHVLGTNHRITAPRHRFQLLQMEPVSERVKAVTLKVAVYEGDEPVTSIETVTFGSASQELGDRQKDLYLVLQDREYNKKTDYRLLLRDAETDIEQQNLGVIIDRAITDDF